MKNKQICPWCGEELLLKEVDEIYEYEIRCRRHRPIIAYKKCCFCRKTIHDKNQDISYAIFMYYSFPIMMLYLFAVMSFLILGGEKGYFTYISDGELLLMLLLSSIALVVVCAIPDLCFPKHRKIRQYYILSDQRRKPLIHKPIITASIEFTASIPAKQRRKEFVKDNILQISANGEREYIILTKADFETGKCEATFPAKKKENGLKLLEKYSEFELSNGEEIIGILKVEKVFE